MKKFRKILLVDDDEITNFLNENLLDALGVAEKVTTIDDAKSALHHIENSCPEHDCPDLILLDLKMPVFDGFDFLNAYRQFPIEKTQSIKIAVLTTSNNPKDLERLKSLGLEHVMGKPLTEEKILSLVNHIQQ